MPLSNALFSGITGLDTTSTAISVIGDNIANVNTPGFKERRAEFADVLSQTIQDVAGFSQLGAGSKTLKISSIFSQGNFESTQRPTDLAIQGRGFFVLEDTQGRSYSRAGVFGFDENGFLVNPQGQRVQGFGVDPVTGLSNGTLGDLQINTSLSPPRATGEIDVAVQLNADSLANNPSVTGPFDPSNPAQTSHFQTAVNFFDSLGNGHPITIFFTQNAADWTWTATLPPGDTTIPPANPGDNFVVQSSGTLTFDTAGELTSPPGLVPVNFAVAGPVATPQSINMDFGPVAGSPAVVTTQFGNPSAASILRQDGFPAGQLQALSIDEDGFLSGLFSNGETLNQGQIALASFPNVEGLVSTGDNNLIETRASGQALVGGPNTGSLGTIRSSSLEQSNVDLAQQFVRMILNQRAFQANTRTISVTNELLAALVSLGQ